MDRRLIGSITAKGGFANEKLIAQKFNKYKTDREAQAWLSYMGYEPTKIKELHAEVVPTRIPLEKASKYGLDANKLREALTYKKSDIQVRIYLVYEDTIFVENISVKKANSNADYNQVDKRKVDDYKNMWNFDEEIALWLKYFTGEIKPPEEYTGRDKRRLFFDEMPEDIVKKILSFFRDNKMLVICDVLKGRGALSADWLMVARYNVLKGTTDFAIADINVAINFFGKGDVSLSERGNLKIGRVVMQRKGGTPDPTKLQFKIRPCQIFEIGG